MVTDWLDLEKRFYNRETNSAVFCVIQQTSIKPQIINPILNSIISANHEKGEGFLPIVKFYNLYCFSSVESLLF